MRAWTEQLFKDRPWRNFYADEKNYMGNDQFLPAYNIQIEVADEYIAVADVMQYRSDMDCFDPWWKSFMRYTVFTPNIR